MKNTSKGPFEPQFCERYQRGWQKMTRNGCKMCKTIVTARLGESVLTVHKQARVQLTRDFLDSLTQNIEDVNIQIYSMSASDSAFMGTQP